MSGHMIPSVTIRPSEVKLIYLQKLEKARDSKENEHATRKDELK